MSVTTYDSNVDLKMGQLFLFIGDTPIAFASSCGLDITTEEIDTSNKMAGSWAGSIAGKKSFTISSESLLTTKTGAVSFDTLLAKQITGEPLDFFFGDATNTNGTYTKDSAKVNYSGKVIVTSLSLKSDNGAIATVSASFKGVGELKATAGSTGA